MSSRSERNRSFREWRRRQAYRVLPVFPPVIFLFIKCLSLTIRRRFSNKEAIQEIVDSGKPFVLAFFHGRQFLLVDGLRRWPNTIMTSISYLGEIQARVLQGFGYQTVEGSSSRGGARVLARMVRLVRSGRIGTFAVDGPRGPYREVKPGAVYVAKKLGIPVVPVSTSARPSLVFTSLWDHYLLPVPFSKALIHFGQPVFLDEEMSEESIQRDCRRLKAVLADLDREVDVLVGKSS